ncbi:hypothetical protein I3760_16G114200 [Carya illinoinensis]|nr:hypothetical protein I3760_16G114200 [Carya illinoinensis]
MAQQQDHHEAAAIDVYFEGPDSVNGHLGQFPYEAHNDCFGIAAGSISSPVMRSCCSSALQSFFQAIAIKTNQSGSIFLQMDEAQDCFNTFQSLHQRTNLNKCEIQQFISSSTPNLCSKGVDSITNFLGFERYSAVYDETCFNCVCSYRQSLQALKEGDSSNGQRCAEALLVRLASSDVNTPNWVYGTFSCLWSEIRPLLSSKELLAIVIAVAVLVILAPILYTLTRKQLRHASEEDMDNLSDEMNKATNSFDNSNLIGEGTLGKMYVGRMPSGMRVAIKRLKEGIKLHTLIDDICQKAKIRHPNLVSTLGYCDRGDECLVSEFCVNGDHESWLLGERRGPILTWEQRLQISIGIARGLWFLQDNPLQKMVHGDIKLTNILLNEKVEPKISDPILSNSKLQKTDHSSGTSDDVLKYGVLLLQLLTGRKSKSLVEEATDAVKKGESVSAMADPRLRGAMFGSESRNLFSIAVLCTVPNECERPTMKQVLQRLEETQILV